MYDLLEEKHKALAFESVWNPSFVGSAIIGKDFKYLCVNDKFCEILEITPAEVVGTSFDNIRPYEIKELYIENSLMVMDGKIRSYFLPQVFKFECGKRINVISLVKGVYDKETGEFLFFINRIIKDEKGEISTETKKYMLLEIANWVDKKKVGMGILLFLSAVGYGGAKFLIEHLDKIK